MMRITAVGVMMLGATAALAQESRWDGADELPVNPLACGEGAAPAAAAKPYDGGQPTGAPDLPASRSRLVDVPKLIGIGYFNATTQGHAGRGRRARQRHGDHRRADQGQHRRADHLHRQLHHPRRQRHPVRRQRPGGDRPGAEEGAGARASTSSATTPTRSPTRASGSSTRPSSTASARRWSTRWPSEIGEDGAFAIVTSTFTTPNQARWIAEMQAYQEACHPNMKWLETVEAQEDNILSFNQATHADQQARRRAQGPVRHDQRRDPGLGRGGDAGQAVRQDRGGGPGHAQRDEALCRRRTASSRWCSGTRSISAMPRPTSLRAVADGKLKPGATEVEAGKLGKLKVVNGSEILLGPPFVYNKDNIDQLRLLSCPTAFGIAARRTCSRGSSSFFRLRPLAGWHIEDRQRGHAGRKLSLPSLLGPDHRQRCFKVRPRVLRR